MSTIDVRSKVLGGILGSAIGDAVGEMAFLYPDKETLLKQINHTSELCYTDDTAMAIGLTESILKEGGKKIKTKMRLIKDLIANNTMPGVAAETLGRSVAVQLYSFRT